MKKIIIALVLTTFIIAGLAAETNFKPYANVSMGLWTTNYSNNDPVIVRLYQNSNFGATLSTNNLEIQAEMGKAMNLRILRATTPLIGGKLTIGQTYITGMDRVTSQGTDETFESDPAAKPGTIFIGRRNQITYALNGGLSVSILEPVKVDPSASGRLTKGLPKIVASYNATLGGFNLLPVIGYGHYWQGENRYNSFLTGINLENNSLAEMKSLVWCGQNPSDMGIITVQSGASTSKNIMAYGGFFQIGGYGFTAGIGYAQNNQNKEAGTAFTNYKIPYGPIIISPEIGYFWGNGYVPNTFYGGIKISASIK